MIPSSLRVGLVAGLAVVVGDFVPASARQDTPVFRSSVQAIEVDVRVTDKAGRPIRNLRQDDFVLLEDGVPQTISTVMFVDLAVDSPIARTIPGNVEPDVVSNSGNGRMWVMLLGGFGERARVVARRFVDEALGPNDQVAVIPVHGTMSSAQGFTRSRRRLLDAIDRLQSDDPAGNPESDDQTAGSKPRAEANRIAFDVLEDLCQRLAAIGGRKSILFFDPPRQWIPPPQEVGAYMSQRDALRCATRNNVAIYVVSTPGMDTKLGERALIDMAAQRVLAEDTGGDAIVNSNNFEDGFQRFVEDSNQYYLLSYTPKVEHKDGEFHSFSVRVNRAGAVVRARRGYYAASADPAPKSRPDSEIDSPELSIATRDALRLPLPVNGLTLDLSAVPFRSPSGGSSVLLTAQARGTDLALGPGELIEVGYRGMSPDGTSHPGAFTVYKLDFGDDSREAVRTSGLRFVEWLTVPPGRHQIRFAVHQPNGKTGMVVSDVEVPNMDRAALSVSGILVASETLRRQRTAREDDSILKFLGAYPTVARSFARTDVLTAYAEAYSTSQTERPLMIATLARASQQSGARPIETKLTVADGRRSGYLARVPLQSLQPGSYVINFDAHAGSQKVSRQLLFWVAEAGTGSSR